jgi:hypothetical protein
MKINQLSRQIQDWSDQEYQLLVESALSEWTYGEDDHAFEHLQDGHCFPGLDLEVNNS